MELQTYKPRHQQCQNVKWRQLCASPNRVREAEWRVQVAQPDTEWAPSNQENLDVLVCMAYVCGISLIYLQTRFDYTTTSTSCLAAEPLIFTDNDIFAPAYKGRRVCAHFSFASAHPCRQLT